MRRYFLPLVVGMSLAALACPAHALGHEEIQDRSQVFLTGREAREEIERSEPHGTHIFGCLRSSPRAVQCYASFLFGWYETEEGWEKLWGTAWAGAWPENVAWRFTRRELAF